MRHRNDACCGVGESKRLWKWLRHRRLDSCGSGTALYAERARVSERELKAAGFIPIRDRSKKCPFYIAYFLYATTTAHLTRIPPPPSNGKSIFKGGLIDGAK
jgi:hypothetical protein